MTNTGSTLGVLDWGIGGLGVVGALRQRGIESPVIYLSDTGVTPYGRMTNLELRTRVDQAIAKLHALRAARVLIACNAASTVIDQLSPDVPVTGMIVPALRSLTRCRATTIGVIGGARTIRSGVYRRGLTDSGRVIRQRIAQPLSAHIEARTLDTATGQHDLERIMRPLRDVELLVLACTHYPAITERLRSHVPRARLFDPATAVATDLAQRLTTRGGGGGLYLVTTGDPYAMRASATDAWGKDPGSCTRVCF